MDFLNNQLKKIDGGMPKMKGGAEKQYVEVEQLDGGSYTATIVSKDDLKKNICETEVAGADDGDNDNGDAQQTVYSEAGDVDTRVEPDTNVDGADTDAKGEESLPRRVEESENPKV